MLDSFTTKELIEVRAITNHRVEEAVDAYMHDPKTGPFALGNSYVLDLEAAVMSDPFAAQVAVLPEAGVALKRAAVWRAIVTARPTKIWTFVQ